MMYSCKEATRLASQAMDRDLTVGERVALRLHFAICRGCRNVGNQIAFLRRAMRRMSEVDEPQT